MVGIFITLKEVRAWDEQLFDTEVQFTEEKVEKF